MPYTLMKGWAWVLLGVLLGIIIGWLLRSIAAKRQVKRARKQNIDAGEIVRLRGRTAELEQAAAERDLLKVELDNYRARGAPSITELQGIASTAGPTESGRSAVERAAPPPLRVPSTAEPDADASRVGAPTAEPDADASTVGVSPVDSDTGAPPAGVAPAEPDGGSPTLPVRPSVAPDLPSPPPSPNVSQAHAVLGVAIQLDDLKVVEGIGPKIESLCHGIGIHTWFDLSTTEVSLLRTMLADAGSRFRTHNPSTWPDQAALLAAGRWADFKALTDGLRGGRAVD